MSNLIEERRSLARFREANAYFSVSTRELTPDVNIMDYLKVHYIYIRPEQISHVFGFINSPSRLYGGRIFDPKHSLTPKHCKELSENGIGISLNLTNHFFDKEAYENSREILECYHDSNNSIMVTNDKLAHQLRQDFPSYTLKASVIKNIKTIPKIEKSFSLYDQITLPMELNDDDEFLSKIAQYRNRIVLFANATCAYNCPRRSCYVGISQVIRGEKVTSCCSKKKFPRPNLGMVYFDVEKLASLGFTQFKLVPDKYSPAKVIASSLPNKRNQTTQTEYFTDKQPTAIIASYPKSGRTWLRFILANYFYYLYKLDFKPDLHNFFSILPNDTPDTARGLSGFSYNQHSTLPLLPFSHRRYSKVECHSKLVLLLRSPFAVMVSDYYQQRDHLKVFDGSLSEFIRDPKRGIQHYCHYLNEWSYAHKKKHFLIFSYEELTANPLPVLEKLLRYINCEVNTEKLSLAIEQSRFNRMKKLEQSQGMKEPGYDRTNPNARRMRKGLTDGYLKELTKADLLWLQHVLTQELSSEALNLLEQHGCFSIPSNKIN